MHSLMGSFGIPHDKALSENGRFLANPQTRDGLGEVRESHPNVFFVFVSFWKEKFQRKFRVK